MLRVPISKARSGMVLALPIYHPNQPARALLRSGVTLEARTILRLRENGVRIVYVRYPGLELLDSFIDPKLIEERAGLTQAITAGFEEVARTAVAPRDFDQYRRRVAALLERITNNRRAALFVDELAEASDPLLEHSASVCFLALLLGIELESYLVRERPRLSPQIASDPAPLGLAGLLHDIGVAALDPEVRQRFDETGDETDPAWREHTRLGYELIRNEVETSVAAAVLNHHQHWDGSGFPTHRQYGRPPISPAGSKIHVFSRVICAADLFNRLRREPSNAENAGEGTSRGVCVPVVRA
ncbi:MAG: HD domain-containing phosphohydrolase, partial [Planctomycetota bacterium]